MINKDACRIGDILIVKKESTGVSWEHDNTENIHVGDTYIVKSLVGRGWNLEKLTGIGPSVLRVLNGDVLTIFDSNR